MPLWKTTLAYDGTPFHGWQVQPDLTTVQGTLAQAIQRITGETVLPQGSGRTDAGVHALAQVASFALDSPIPPANFHRALNHALPPSIRVLSIEHAPARFHARHSALRKTYEYRIHPSGSICSPMLAPYVWACPFPLDLATLQQAATHILGTHDFASFAAVDPDLTTRTTDQESRTTAVTAPAPSTNPPGTKTGASSSTASPAMASSITWSATSSEPSSKSVAVVSPPTPFPPSSPPATAPPLEPPLPPPVSSSSRSNTNDPIPNKPGAPSSAQFHRD